MLHIRVSGGRGELLGGERVGQRPDSSPGWRWLVLALRVVQRSPGGAQDRLLGFSWAVSAAS